MFLTVQSWRRHSSPVVYIDGSFVKHKIPVKPIYITLRNLNSVVSGKAAAWRVLGIMPTLRKSATLEQTDTWRKERRLRLHHANIIHRWYYVPESFKHDFPQSFRTVPSINDSDRIWRTGKDVKDVIGRLLGQISNDTDDNLIPPIMGYFEDIVDMATKQFVDIKRRFNLNEHHTDVTRKMKQAGKFAFPFAYNFESKYGSLSSKYSYGAGGLV
jgi:hypothetical protein